MYYTLISDARTKLRDAEAHVRAMAAIEPHLVKRGPIAGFADLEAYRREFAAALNALQGVAYRLLETDDGAAYEQRFKTVPVLGDIQRLRGKDTHEIAAGLAIATTIDADGERSCVTVDSAVLRRMNLERLTWSSTTELCRAAVAAAREILELPPR